ncbi:hypothetical protein SAMN05216213_104223 [Ectopseudomonas guguanensis]|uniref:Uncharacterized protein n=1 Tax=Ectopseudomonas guguanensis TaxID=1198456 RepID=A0A1H0TNF6_9GAMM|nr:hypothetical protein SAMN05216213_104223 [Pseudomonas guguanensis]
MKTIKILLPRQWHSTYFLGHIWSFYIWRNMKSAKVTLHNQLIIFIARRNYPPSN